MSTRRKPTFRPFVGQPSTFRPTIGSTGDMPAPRPQAFIPIVPGTPGQVAVGGYPTTYATGAASYVRPVGSVFDRPPDPTAPLVPGQTTTTPPPQPTPSYSAPNTPYVNPMAPSATKNSQSGHRGSQRDAGVPPARRDDGVPPARPAAVPAASFRPAPGSYNALFARQQQTVPFGQRAQFVRATLAAQQAGANLLAGRGSIPGVYQGWAPASMIPRGRAVLGHWGGMGAGRSLSRLGGDGPVGHWRDTPDNVTKIGGGRAAEAAGNNMNPAAEFKTSGPKFTGNGGFKGSLPTFKSKPLAHSWDQPVRHNHPAVASAASTTVANTGPRRFYTDRFGRVRPLA